MPIVAMLGAVAAGSSFTPVINTYDTGTNVLETIPEGARVLSVGVQAGGGGGGRGPGGTDGVGGGGGQGGHVLLGPVGVLQSEWDTTLTYSVGAAGTGELFLGGAATNGGNSYVIGEVGGSVRNLQAGGGVATNGQAGGNGGTASGGTVNTAGEAGEDAVQIQEEPPVYFPGSGGGTEGNRGSGGRGAFSGVDADDGIGGRIIFSWS